MIGKINVSIKKKYFYWVSLALGGLNKKVDGPYDHLEVFWWNQTLSKNNKSSNFQKKSHVRMFGRAVCF